jgi:hypothetical protein
MAGGDKRRPAVSPEPAAVPQITAEQLHGWFAEAISERRRPHVPDARLCAALAVQVNAWLRIVLPAHEIIFGTDRGPERAAFAQVVQDARRLQSSLQRIEPFPVRRLFIGPSPEAEMDAAVKRGEPCDLRVVVNVVRRCSGGTARWRRYRWRAWRSCAATFAHRPRRELVLRHSPDPSAITYKMTHKSFVDRDAATRSAAQ